MPGVVGEVADAVQAERVLVPVGVELGEAFGEGRVTEDDADDVFSGVEDDESGFDGEDDDDEL